jgi:two-component system, OmpR family, sensor histidine kinase KdpD
MLTITEHGRFGVLAGRRPWSGYLAGGLGLGLVTAGAEFNHGRLNPVTISLAYLLVVLPSATLGGIGPGIATSVIGFLTFNFFFLPPYNTFIVGAPQDIVALFVFLIVAGVTSSLVSRLREREREARRRAIESETLSQLSTALIADLTLDTVLATVAEQVMYAFHLQSAAIILPDATGALQPRFVFPPGMDATYLLNREHRAVATHVFMSGVATGIGRQNHVYRSHRPSGLADAPTERAGRVLYVPVRTARRSVGVLGVTAARRGDFTADERRLLTTFANQAALAIDRAHLIEEATRAAALEQADQLKSVLLTAVSHDLRTPLASIKAAATSLLQEDIDWHPTARRDFLTAINEETDRLTRFVGNLLDLSRIQGGVLRPEKEWYDIGEVIRAVSRRLAPLLDTHRLQVTITPDLPLLRFDYVEIAQVLANLIENAAKYSASGTEIAVTAGCADSGVQVCVADRGFGILAADLPHVFDTFYRVRRSGQERRVAGTGIGLAICKGFVEAHGGTIGVESRAGQGTTFCFSLPVTAVARSHELQAMGVGET